MSEHPELGSTEWYEWVRQKIESMTPLQRHIFKHGYYSNFVVTEFTPSLNNGACVPR